MKIERDIIGQLKLWKNKDGRKPLLFKGTLTENAILQLLVPNRMD